VYFSQNKLGYKIVALSNVPELALFDAQSLKMPILATAGTTSNKQQHISSEAPTSSMVINRDVSASKLCVRACVLY
jgi:hypothetical protein